MLLICKKVAFILKDNANKDSWKNIAVIYNGEPEKAVSIELPKGNWNVVVDKNAAGTEVLRVVKNKVEVEPLSICVLYQ